MPDKAELKITLTAQGGVEIRGPIDNKLLCYGLLACAHDAIKDYTDAKARSGIIPVAPMPNVDLRGM